MDFDQLYDSYADTVFAYLKFHLRDLFRETFLSVYRKLEQGESIRSPKTWILSIAYRRMADHWRKISRVPLTPVPGPPEPHVRTLAWSIDGDMNVRELLDLLDPASRDIMHGVYVVGLTFREMAEVLGIPEGTVKSRCRCGAEDKEAFFRLLLTDPEFRVMVRDEQMLFAAMSQVRQQMPIDLKHKLRKRLEAEAKLPQKQESAQAFDWLSWGLDWMNGSPLRNAMKLIREVTQ